MRSNRISGSMTSFQEVCAISRRLRTAYANGIRPCRGSAAHLAPRTRNLLQQHQLEDGTSAHSSGIENRDLLKSLDVRDEVCFTKLIFVAVRKPSARRRHSGNDSRHSECEREEVLRLSVEGFRSLPSSSADEQNVVVQPAEDPRKPEFRARVHIDAFSTGWRALARVSATLAKARDEFSLGSQDKLRARSAASRAQVLLVRRQFH